MDSWGKGSGAVRLIMTTVQFFYKKFAWLSKTSVTSKLIETGEAGTDEMAIEAPTLVKLAARTPRSLTACASGLALP